MSTGQAVGAVVGGAIGFFASGGTPMGLAYGAQIGMMAGGYLDPPKGPTQEGPRLSDSSVQTSTYGAFIPRTYGTVAINGNIFWLENNKIKETVKKKKSGGKGGGSSVTTKTYSYSATLAIGICEGPIDGIKRIWAGPNLIYDSASTDIGSAIATNRTGSKFTFYLGDDTQLPDSRIQADLGSANVPAYRGLAYVVIRDFALANYGNAIPQFKFEVVNAAAVAPIQVMDVAEPYISTQSGIVFGGATLATVNKFANSYPDTLNQANYYGTTRKLAAVQCTGSLLGGATLYPVRTISDDYLNFRMTGRGQVYADGFTFNVRWISGSYAEIVYSNDIVYYKESGSGLGLVWADKFGSRKVLSGYTIISICMGDGELLAITATQILRINKDTMELIAAVNFTSDWSITGSDDWISYHDGGLWVLPKANGILQKFDPVTGAKILNLTVPFTFVSYAPGHIADGILTQQNLGTKKILSFNLAAMTSSDIPLSSIVSAECLRTGLLSSGDFDVTALDDSVTGYRVGKIGGIRQAIEPLQGAFMFDVIQSGYQIKFISRGGSSVASPVIGDLGVDQQLKQTREMDSQMPVNISANYLDKGRNYDSNTQTWERLNTDSVNTRSLDLPIVLTATQAAQIVERLGGLYWMERVDFGPFTLPPTYSHLEPADVITLDAGYAVYEMRLTSVNYKSDGSLECMARPNSAAVYVSNATAVDVDQSGSVAFAGVSDYELLDVPPVSGDLQDGPGMIAVMAGHYADWSSGAIYSSNDNSQTWNDLQSFAGPCTYGYARAALPANEGHLINFGDTLTVDLIAGELESVTQEQMLKGSNVCAYGINGRMEVFRFMNATLNGDGSYTLSGFIRGDFGSEWATGLHKTGDIFALLTDADAAVITFDQSAIGVERNYRGITNGDDIDSDSSRPVTYAGANLKPLSPCQAKATRASGDITMTWKRRSRYTGWYSYVDAPLGETVESYSIDIMSGTNVLRTIASSTQTAVYSSADQTTDFGSPQSSLTVRIYQISSVVGRGNKLEVTL